MAQFTDTLAAAAGDMSVVLIVIAIVATGYGIAFHMAFGHVSAAYMDFPEALMTLFSATSSNGWASRAMLCQTVRTLLRPLDTMRCTRNARARAHTHRTPPRTTHRPLPF